MPPSQCWDTVCVICAVSQPKVSSSSAFHTDRNWSSLAVRSLQTFTAIPDWTDFRLCYFPRAKRTWVQSELYRRASTTTPENGNQILPARKVTPVLFLEIKAGNHITGETNFCFSSPDLTAVMVCAIQGRALYADLQSTALQMYFSIVSASLI